MVKSYLDKEIQILNVAEGFEPRPYQDIHGFWTWGIGRNYQGYPLTFSEKKFLIGYSGLNIDPAITWSLAETTNILHQIPEDKCRTIADFFVKQVLIEIDSRLYAQTGWFAECEDARKSAWLDLSYNCGLSAVMSWRESLKLMEDEQYEELAAHLLTFPWANQVHADKPNPHNPKGGRAYYITEMLRTGEFPEWLQ